MDHSQFIQNVSCVAQGLRIDLTTPEATSFVQSAWNTSFVVITSSVDCSSTVAGQHSYWLVRKVFYPDEELTALLDAIEVAIEDVLDEVNLEWGTHVPQNSTTLPSSTDSTSDGGVDDSTDGEDDDDDDADYYDCESPDSPETDGLPFALCGSDFDDDLDDFRGYYNFDDEFSTALQDFAPGLDSYSEDEYDEDDVPEVITVNGETFNTSGVDLGSRLAKRQATPTQNSADAKEKLKAVQSAQLLSSAAAKAVTSAQAEATTTSKQKDEIDAQVQKAKALTQQLKVQSESLAQAVEKARTASVKADQEKEAAEKAQMEAGGKVISAKGAVTKAQAALDSANKTKKGIKEAQSSLNTAKNNLKAAETAKTAADKAVNDKVKAATQASNALQQARKAAQDASDKFNNAAKSQSGLESEANSAKARNSAAKIDLEIKTKALNDANAKLDATKKAAEPVKTASALEMKNERKIASDPVPPGEKKKPKGESSAVAKDVAQKAIDYFGKSSEKVAQVKGILQKAQSVVNGVKQGYKIAKKVVNVLTSGAAADATLNIDITPESKDEKNVVEDSPWGRAYEITNNAIESDDGSASAEYSLYCVGCGIKGKVHIAGQVSFSLSQRALTKGNVAIDGGLVAKLYLGLQAQGSVKNTKNYPIWSAPLPPGFSIPQLITLGPSISMDASLKVSIDAAGTVLAGAEAEFKDFSASIDLFSKQKLDVAGFEPKLTPKFAATGQIKAKARLGFPLSIGIYLGIPLIDFNRGISIANEPYIKGVASYGVAESCPKGIDYSVGGGDNLYADVLRETTLTLATYKASPLTTGCLPLPTLPGLPSEGATGGSASSQPEQIDDEVNHAPLDEVINLADAANKAKTFSGPNPDVAYSRIVDTAGSLYLTADDDGALSVSDTATDATLASQTFAFFRGAVTEDGRRRLLYFSPETMEKLGVSRLRLAAMDSIAYGANAASLIPVPFDDKTSVLVPVNTLGTNFYTVACNINDDHNEVFIVQDVEKGIQKLLDATVRDAVTGGPTSNCNAVIFKSPVARSLTGA